RSSTRCTLFPYTTLFRSVFQIIFVVFKFKIIGVQSNGITPVNTLLVPRLLVPVRIFSENPLCRTRYGNQQKNDNNQYFFHCFDAVYIVATPMVCGKCFTLENPILRKILFNSSPKGNFFADSDKYV